MAGLLLIRLFLRSLQSALSVLLACAIAAGGCTDATAPRETPPLDAPLLFVSRATQAIPPDPRGERITVPPLPAVFVQSSLYYPDPVLTRLVFTGKVTVVRTDPRHQGETYATATAAGTGGEGSCRLQTYVRHTNSHTFEAKPCEATSVEAKFVMQYGISASRGSGLSLITSYCGYPGADPCLGYTGATYVDVTPIAPGNLILKVNKPNPKSGEGVEFLMEAPQSGVPGVGFPIRPFAWTWRADDPARQQSSWAGFCHYGNLYCRPILYSSGTVTAEAIVGGFHRQMSLHVTVGGKPEVSLACPESVTRGQAAECRVMWAPSGDVQIRSWSFQPSDGAAAMTRSSDVASTVWAGAMVQSGRVTVVARVQGTDTTVTADITVNARQWKYERPYATSDTRTDWDPPAADRSWGLPGMGSAAFSLHPGISLRSPATVRVIPVGPNQGFAYILQVDPLREPRVWLHPGLFSGPWLADQNGGLGLNGRRRCVEADVEHVRRQALRHESRTGSPQSHVGFENQLIVQQGIAADFERQTTRADALDFAQAVLFARVRTIWARFEDVHRASDDAFDAAELPTIYPNCEWDNDPTDP